MSEQNYMIGLDIGQRRDPTALVVAEAVPTLTGRAIHARDCGALSEVPAGKGLYCRETCRPELWDVFRVHDLGRLALGTSYPDVVAAVNRVVERLNDDGIAPYVLVDTTGVGRPVVDMLSDGLTDRSYVLSAVTIVGGDYLRGGLGSNEVSAGKEYIVSRLQVLLDHRRVLLPRGRESRALVRELKDFDLKATATGMTAGAFRTGTHDDLAIALGLATLYDPSRWEVREVPSPFFSA